MSKIAIISLFFIGLFQLGTAQPRLFQGEQGHWGYRHPSKDRVAIDPDYHLATPFEHGLAKVELADGFRLINEKGKTVFGPCRYIGWSNDCRRDSFRFCGEYIGVNVAGVWRLWSKKRHALVEGEMSDLSYGNDSLMVKVSTNGIVLWHAKGEQQLQMQEVLFVQPPYLVYRQMDGQWEVHHLGTQVVEPMGVKPPHLVFTSPQVTVLYHPASSSYWLFHQGRWVRHISAYELDTISQKMRLEMYDQITAFDDQLQVQKKIFAQTYTREPDGLWAQHGSVRANSPFLEIDTHTDPKVSPSLVLGPHPSLGLDPEVSFEKVLQISDSLYIIESDGYWATVHQDGLEVHVDTGSYLVLPDATIRVAHGQNVGLLNQDGRLIVPVKYESITATACPFLVKASREDQSWYYHLQDLDQPDSLAYLPFEWVGEAGEDGVIPVKQHHQWGCINHLGQLRIATRYEELRPVSEHKYPFKLNGLWGWINAQEKIVIQPIYQDVGKFAQGRTWAKWQGRYGLINAQGEWKTKPEFDKITLTLHGNWLTELNGQMGLICGEDLNGFYPQYDYLEDLGNDKVIARKKGMMGVLDYSGKTILPFRFSQIQSLKTSKGSYWIIGTEKLPDITIDLKREN